MEINGTQVIEILNRRAQTEPLIAEILRSAMFEAALRSQDTSASQATMPPANTPEDALDIVQ